MATSVKPTLPILNLASSLVQNLVMALPMTENAGTNLADISGNGYAGTLSGGFTWVADSLMGTVINLDGLSGVVDLAAGLLTAFGSNAASFSAWVRLDAASPAAGLRGFANLDNLNVAGQLALLPNGFTGFNSPIFRNDITIFALGATVLTNWTLITLTTVNGGNYKCYINGTLVGSVSALSTVQLAGALQFGRSDDGFGGTERFDGRVGDLRLWDRELEQWEVQTIFNNPWGLYVFDRTIAQVYKGGVQADLTQGHGRVGSAARYALQVDFRGGPPPIFGGANDHVAGENYSINRFALQVDFDVAGAPALAALANDQHPSFKPSASGSPVLNNNPHNTGLVLAVPFNDAALATANPVDYALAHVVTMNPAHWTTDSLFLHPNRTSRSAFNSTPAGAVVTRTAALEPAAAVSIAAWIKPSSIATTTRPYVAKLAPSTGYSYYLGQCAAANQIRFEIKDVIDGTAFANGAPSNYVNGVWYHVVGVYDQANALLRLYVNGQQIATASDTGNISYDITRNVGIGQDGNGALPFPGSIDDVRIWDRVITPAEVLELFNNGKRELYGYGGSFGAGNETPGAFGAYVNRTNAARFALQADFSLAQGYTGALNNFALQVDMMPGIGTGG